MTSVDDARRRVLTACRRLSPAEVPLEGALGLVLAAGVSSTEPVPPFANSAMDGYAVRSADVRSAPSKLREVGAVMAGDAPGRVAVGEGEAVRIMTGAPLPPGADAVCMVELTRSSGGWVVIEEPVASGTHVRVAGDDIRAGGEVLPAGAHLGAAQLALLSAVGTTSVFAYPRPRVGVLSTGDELVNAPGPLPPGKVRDSNRPGLVAQLRADGFEAIDLGNVADDSHALAALLEQAVRGCDAVLTSGGVSMGDRDLVKVVLGQLGGPQSCWLRVAVRPAKPLAFSTVPPDGVPVFGLPGNPVSALVSYELFARPALRFMAGHTRLGRPTCRAECEEPLARQRDGKLHLLRVSLSVGRDGRLRVRLAGGQASHQLRALARADGLALVPDGDGLKAGEQADVWVLDTDVLAGGDDWAP
jgi:molybdopterin molybdotransferase